METIKLQYGPQSRTKCVVRIDGAGDVLRDTQRRRDHEKGELRGIGDDDLGLTDQQFSIVPVAYHLLDLRLNFFAKKLNDLSIQPPIHTPEGVSGGDEGIGFQRKDAVTNNGNIGKAREIALPGLDNRQMWVAEDDPEDGRHEIL